MYVFAGFRGFGYTAPTAGGINPMFNAPQPPPAPVVNKCSGAEGYKCGITGTVASAFVPNTSLLSGSLVGKLLAYTPPPTTTTHRAPTALDPVAAYNLNAPTTTFDPNQFSTMARSESPISKVLIDAVGGKTPAQQAQEQQNWGTPSGGTPPPQEDITCANLLQKLTCAQIAAAPADVGACTFAKSCGVCATECGGAAAGGIGGAAMIGGLGLLALLLLR